MSPSHRFPTSALLLAVCLAGATGCVAADYDPSISGIDQPGGGEEQGKADGDDEPALSPALSAVLLSGAYFDALDQIEGTLPADPLYARRLALAGFSETSSGQQTIVRMVVESAPVAVVPAISRIEGYLEAVVSGTSAPVVESVTFHGESLGMDAVTEPTAELGVLWADARVRSNLRDLVATRSAVRILNVAQLDRGAEAVIVVHLRAEATGGAAVNTYELVARFVDRPEHAARPDSVALYEDGVISHVKTEWHSAWEFFPGNGYFAYDDPDAFRREIWQGYATSVAPGPAPHIGDGEVLVGFVTHYFPYAGKSMAVESVEDAGSEVIVKLVVTWDAFACFEHLADAHLYDLIKVRAAERPIVVQVIQAVGPGCDTGVNLPPTEPVLAQQVRIEAGERNRATLCTATGNFNDAPFEDSCQIRPEPPVP
ncbi:MAG: hypothetical protein JRI55_10800 [Deltaproteobacteria bacterium]|nr:hypothetical protein [Deltaproteobacteria bacterium]